MSINAKRISASLIEHRTQSDTNDIWFVYLLLSSTRRPRMTSTSDVPLSIVRIKRKLNTSTNHGPALASGSAATAGPSSSAASERSGPETLMLAEPSRKRTRINPQQQGQESNPNQPFFTFAETVPVSTFDAEATALRERLKSLASAQEQQQHASVQPSTSAPAFTHTQELLPKMTQKERFKVIRKSRGDAFDMVDVDLDLDAGGRPLPVRKRRKAGNARTRQSEQQEAAEREKMEQFNDLLREYLSCAFLSRHGAETEMRLIYRFQ